MTSTLIEQARESLRMAESVPGRAVALASAVAGQARAARDHAASSVAARALGLAALHREDLGSSMRHLRAAINYGRRAGAPELAAQARMTLAFVASSRGWPRRGLREIDTALRDLRGVDRARGEAQRGVILHQLGDLDAALASYNTALPALRSAGDRMWVWRILSNRGVLHGYRLELAKAAADLYEAGRLCEELGLAMSVAFTQQNLGWVHTLRGDVPLALAYLDKAEQQLRELDAQLGTILRDRIELLLSVHLVSEARVLADSAVAELERERRMVVLPEVRLLLAQAAMLDGEPGVALHQARRAVRELSRQDRPGWLALARFAVLTARLAGDRGSRVGVRQAEAAAAALEATPWTAAATEARLVAARLALRRGWTAQAVAQLERPSRAIRRGPAMLRARAWYATALLRLAKGEDRATMRALRTGLRIIDENRAAFGATDLRARTAGHRTDLAGLGLRIALGSGGARQVLEWAERSRASLFLIRPVRPPEDPELAGLLAELRAATAEVDELRRAGHSPHRALARQVVLERRVRDHCRRQPGTGELLEPTSADLLATELGDAALVELVELDQQLHAVTVVAGRARLHRLGPTGPVDDLLDRLPFALRRLGRHTTKDSHLAALAVLHHAGAKLDAILLGPLAADLGDAPLVLVPTGRLQSMPWSILPSCAGRPVTVAPSAASWYLARTRQAQVTGEVAVVAGPALPGAGAEAEAVARIYATTALAPGSATAEATKAALTGADLAHLATHGRMSAENPLFSSLVLTGGPLMVYDIERLARVPSTVVLAACDTGRHTVWAGDELLGLTATFLTRGTQQLIAPVVPIPDVETAPLMIELHRRLAAGAPAAQALASAQAVMTDADTVTMAAAAGFVCVGAGLALAGRTADTHPV
ncbi:MAG TPA: CHAT domain-containing protein [Micromonosporaceae bacterium]|nr:CHAT domain-containing protein [Micromonosporaceae bacterium]